MVAEELPSPLSEGAMTSRSEHGRWGKELCRRPEFVKTRSCCILEQLETGKEPHRFDDKVIAQLLGTTQCGNFVFACYITQSDKSHNLFAREMSKKLSMESTHLQILAYPLDKKAQLCAVLDRESVWLACLTSSKARNAAKKVLKSVRPLGPIQTRNDLEFGPLLLWLMRDAVLREKLDHELRRETKTPLYQHLFRAFDDESILPTSAICNKKRDGKIYLDTRKFASWLQDRKITKSEAEIIAIVACAFALLQPSSAKEIVKTMTDRHRIFVDLLEASSMSRAGECSESVVGEEISTVHLERHNNRDELRPSHRITIDELRKGASLIEKTIASIETLEQQVKGLEVNFRNHYSRETLDIVGPIEDLNRHLKDARDFFVHARNWKSSIQSAVDAVSPGKLQRAMELEPRLSQFSDECKGNGIGSATAHGNFSTIRELLSELITSANDREKQIVWSVLEIRRLNSDLGGEVDAGINSMIDGDLIDQIIYWDELENAHVQLKLKIERLIDERRSQVFSKFTQFDQIYDLELLSEDVKNRYKQLWTEIKSCSSLESLEKAESATEALRTELARMPELRDIAQLSLEASSGSPGMVTLLPLIQALNRRKRFSESIALATSYQIVHQLELESPIDISQLLVEISSAASALAGEGYMCWIDAILQQQWIRNASRSQIADYRAWQRLALALVVQHLLRGTDQEMDLFFRLDYQNSWPKERYPIVGKCIDHIAARRQFQLVQSAQRSAMAQGIDTVVEFLRKNDRGDYLEQAASSDDFYKMEKLHLFPSLERLWQDVVNLCQSGRPDEAAARCHVKPEKLLVDACRSAGIDSNGSVFYRRKTLHEQEGYIPVFLKHLSSYIELSKGGERDTSGMVHMEALLKEIKSLSEADGSPDQYWKAIASSLSNPIHLTQWSDSAVELVVRLSRRCASVVLMARDFLIARCQEGGAAKMSEVMFEKMVYNLGKGVPEIAVKELLGANCLYAANVILDSLDTQRVPEMAQTRKEMGKLLADTIEGLRLRHLSLSDSNLSPFSNEDFHKLVEDDLFTFVDHQLSIAETEQHEAALTAREQVLELLKKQGTKNQEIREQAINSQNSDAWHETVFGYCSKLEAQISRSRRDIIQGKSTPPATKVICDSIVALDFVVNSNANSFTEVEHLLSQLPGNCEAHVKQPQPMKMAQSIEGPWNYLKSTSGKDAHAIGVEWESLAKNFCASCRLYYDLHASLKLMRIKGYSWHCYTTAFHNPRSNWLDREVRMYLCLGDAASSDELEVLAVELEKSRHFLNLVFVPQGVKRVARFLKYDNYGTSYLIVDEKLLGAMSSSLDKGGELRCDLPLRQALHQTVENLEGVGLFKSEGYVHYRKNIFVGRREALQQLRQQPASVIWGGRRTGKTSLLQALGEALKNSRISEGPYEVALVYADKAADDPDLAIARAISQDLGLDSPRSLADFEVQMREICSEKRIAILIDEMDRYIELSRKAHGATSFPLARTLRGLSQWNSLKIKLVYAGFKQLFYEVKLRPGADPSDPFKNIVMPVLKDFRDLLLHEVEELMTIGFVEMLGFKLEPSVPRLVTEKTSGHPAFVQRFCERLLARVSYRRQLGVPLTISEADVINTYEEETSYGSNDTAFIDYVNETLGWNVSHLERAILLAISADIKSAGKPYHTEYSAGEISDMLKYWCDSNIELPDVADFQHSLLMLSMTKMLTVSGATVAKRYKITYRAYVDFMDRLDKVGKVEIFRSLQDYHDQEKGAQ